MPRGLSRLTGVKVDMIGHHNQLVIQHGWALVLLISTGLWVLPAMAQDPVPDTAAHASEDMLTVFLGCEECNEQYIRRQITFVSYVRDRKQADVHVLGTVQSMGGGGQQYTIEFIGQGGHEGTSYVLTYTADPTDVKLEVEEGLVNTLAIGLAPFVHGSTAGSRLGVTYESTQKKGSNTQQENDPWKNWVFEVRLSGGLEQEQSQGEYSLDLGLEANRVTALWRMRNEFQIEYDRDVYEREEETISSMSRNTGFETSVVRSINDHWSIGGFGDLYTDTYQNMALGVQLAPAIEYNVFPYRMIDRKELTFAYRIGPRRLDYLEETIFGRTEQFAWEHSLDIEFNLNQRWGFVYVGLEGAHYLHDFQKNRLEFDSSISLRLIEGLALEVGVEADLIHDQLHIPKGETSLEEVLLQRRDLLTSYEYEVSVGFSYTFGSIYNNVVNTRL